MNPSDLSAIPRNEMGIEIYGFATGKLFVPDGVLCAGIATLWSRDGLSLYHTIRDLMLAGF